MLHSINQMMLFHMEAECRRFYQLCFHCTKLGIDVYSPSTYRELKGMREMSHRWISIPFPSNYHRDTSSSSLSRSSWVLDVLGLGLAAADEGRAGADCGACAKREFLDFLVFFLPGTEPGGRSSPPFGLFGPPLDEGDFGDCGGSG